MALLFTFTRFAEVVCSSAYPSRTLKAKKLPTLQKLFTFPCNFKCKDLVIWSPDSAVSTESLLLHEGIYISKVKILNLKNLFAARHTTSLLYLENSKFLVRRCCLSGKLEERFFLSDSIKFNEMTTESESDIITLKSTRIKETTDGGDAVFAVAVFSSPPLKFVAMFEVNCF